MSRNQEIAKAKERRARAEVARQRNADARQKDADTTPLALTGNGGHRRTTMAKRKSQRAERWALKERIHEMYETLNHLSGNLTWEELTEHPLVQQIAGLVEELGHFQYVFTHRITADNSLRYFVITSDGKMFGGEEAERMMTWKQYMVKQNGVDFAYFDGLRLRLVVKEDYFANAQAYQEALQRIAKTNAEMAVVDARIIAEYAAEDAAVESAVAGGQQN
jgi:hypothetical protein